MALDNLAYTTTFAPLPGAYWSIPNGYFNEGDTRQFTPQHEREWELLLNADVEPDADRDGYGDETQDACPGDPATFETCRAELSISARVDPRHQLAGRAVRFLLTVRNAGTSVADDVVVKHELPPNHRFVSAASTLGSCTTAQSTLTCTVGTLANDSSATITVVAEPASAGPSTSTATVSSATLDPLPGNNADVAEGDVYEPGPCTNVTRGRSGDDVMKGSPFGDRLRGFGGRDQLRGRAGRDCVSGGRASDRLFGGGGRDRLAGGSGQDVVWAGDARDSVAGGRQSDTIRVRGGGIDVVDCGPGAHDRVIADARDRVRRCEIVRRAR